MKIFEEHLTPTDKQRSCKGLKQGQISGKATGYLLMLREYKKGFYSVYADAEGFNLLKPKAVELTTVTAAYLRENCRQINGKYMPQAWQKEFLKKLLPVLGTEGVRDWARKALPEAFRVAVATQDKEI